MCSVCLSLVYSAAAVRNCEICGETNLKSALFYNLRFEFQSRSSDSELMDSVQLSSASDSCLQSSSIELFFFLKIDNSSGACRPKSSCRHLRGIRQTYLFGFQTLETRFIIYCVCERISFFVFYFHRGSKQ